MYFRILFEDTWNLCLQMHNSILALEVTFPGLLPYRWRVLTSKMSHHHIDVPDSICSSKYWFQLLKICNLLVLKFFSSCLWLLKLAANFQIQYESSCSMSDSTYWSWGLSFVTYVNLWKFSYWYMSRQHQHIYVYTFMLILILEETIQVFPWQYGILTCLEVISASEKTKAHYESA